MVTFGEATFKFCIKALKITIRHPKLDTSFNLIITFNENSL